ncbi:head scaffolding protein [Arthrobacter phage Constance]|uniref:Scaffolding protein n=4 Tax=Bridgettevirus TaxID=2733170 RepID=A0A3G2KIA3_9CAUD|nr:head scaffolding protein [Arthrobacter phage Constance]YP_009815420.1 head scaffolding protein [Arthrobacter phage Eileen]YP_009815483.1 head scaffolding protein [Arthrobacter phage Judy]YP_009815555.1 head scaffolding protein [Arthrobacter phage Peas]UVK58398.1 scaffolding protein [Arthrobacter phage GlobiWarming]WMI32946.1 scaffolding protein [Arthrobacter phage PeggyLeg03]AYN57411.1 scaffolding protein [Arthrobacter phage Constance]AYN57797.1 scaffolding protein [Arthrobacter phage Eil
MSDGTPNGGDNGGSNGGGGDGGNTWTPPATQEEFNRIISERLGRERSKYADYADLKNKASQFDELTASQQTELQREQTLRQTAENTARETAAKLARAEAAIKYKNLTAEDLDLLGEGTPEEIDARAKRLSERLTPPPPNFDGGARSTAPGGKDMNSLIRKAAGLG